VRAASVLLMAAVFGGVTLSVFWLGTVRAPPTAFYAVAIIMAGALFEQRGAAAMVVLSALAVFGLIGAENAGWMPEPDYRTGITQGVTYAAVFVWVGYLIYRAYGATRRALADLRQADTRLQSVITAMSAGVLVLDTGGRVTACNAGAERLLGKPAGQIVGQLCMDLCADAIRADGSRLPHAEHPAARTLNTGEPQQSPPIGVLRPDGAHLVENKRAHKERQDA